MEDVFVPCEACARFVRSTEIVCPFCRAHAAPQLADATPIRSGLRTRLAAIAGAALLVGACGGDAEPDGRDQDESAGDDVVQDDVAPDDTADTAGGDVAHGEGGGLQELGDQEVSCAGRCGSHHNPPCMQDDPPCPAPPYGAPPVDDLIA